MDSRKQSKKNKTEARVTHILINPELVYNECRSFLFPIFIEPSKHRTKKFGAINRRSEPLKSSIDTVSSIPRTKKKGFLIICLLHPVVQWSHSYSSIFNGFKKQKNENKMKFRRIPSSWIQASHIVLFYFFHFMASSQHREEQTTSRILQTRGAERRERIISSTRRLAKPGVSLSLYPGGESAAAGRRTINEP